MAVMTLRVEGSRALFIHLESLERLSELEIAAVYPGHGRPFVNAAEAISRAKAKTEAFLKNRERLGDDLLKKIIIYTLMMHQEVEETSFFERLMATIWFRETVDLYFNSEYRMKYDDIIRDLSERGLVKHKGVHVFSTAKR
jgi:glyoxylase-like metal-dependent hydrolase (beta-lactamase superfamily II)